MKERKTIVMHFKSKLKFLHWVDVLNQNKISISEVYIPEFMPILEQKLRVRKFKWDAFIRRFGYFFGAVVVTFSYYLIQGSVAGHFNQISYEGPALSLIITAAIFVFAEYLFPSKAPKIRRLTPNDQRYLLVVKYNSIMRQKLLIKLMKYSEGFEVSADVKNMIIR